MINPTDVQSYNQKIRALVQEQRTTEAESVMELPSQLYTDSAYYEREKQTLFFDRPIVLALSAHIAKANSYTTLEHVPGFNLLITRDSQGAVHGFFNSCLHRGAPVATGSAEKARFSCPYHSWTYNCAGDLVAVSSGDSFGSLPNDVGRLVSFPVEERDGIVWGIPNPSASIDLKDWLSHGYDVELQKLKLDEVHVMWTQQFSGPNWKICKDGFIENYHFASVHSKSLPTLIGNINLTEEFGRHSRIFFPHKHIVDPQREDSDENCVGNFETTFYTFPNTMISSVWGDWPLMTRIFPGKNADESVCVQTLLCRLPYTTSLQETADGLKDLYRSVTQQEDYVLDYAIQRSLSGHPPEHFYLGRNERALQHFHKTIASEMAR